MPTSSPLQLTDREQEVAELVGLGLTNRQIAERLVLSHATVTSHVSHIMAKLNVNRRSQIAAIVATQRLDEPQPRDVPPRPAGTASGTPTVWRGYIAAAMLALLFFGSGWYAIQARSQLSGNEPGPLLFSTSDPAALARLQPRVRTETGEQGDAVAFVPNVDPRLVRFDAEGVHLNPADAFILVALTDTPLADLIADVTLRRVDGDSSYMLQFRGCPRSDTDFYAIRIHPASGTVQITRDRCTIGTVESVLLPPARRLRPVQLGEDQPLRVLLTGNRIAVYEAGQLAAEATDPSNPLPPGGVRVAALPGGSMLLRELSVYGPAENISPRG